MNSEPIEQYYSAIMEAVRPEEIFGDLGSPYALEQKIALRKSYDEIKSAIDAEKCSEPDKNELAEVALARLKEFMDAASQYIDLEIYGINRREARPRTRRGVEPTIIKAAKRDYYVDTEHPIAEGDLSMVYRGDCAIGESFAGQVAVKITNDPSDNDLVMAGVRVLKELFKAGGAQVKHLPTVLDTFQTDQNQSGLVMRYLDTCYDLETVRSRPKYKNGIDPMDMVWMLNRALSVAGYWHSLGIIHGNIQPAHLMIRPKDHNLFVIGWSGGIFRPAQTSETFKLFNDDFSAPEVLEKGIPLPSTDIYSIGLSMIYLLGGNVSERTVPEGVEEELARFLEVMTMISPRQRSQDAWQLHYQLEKLVVRLWGPKKFRPFEI